MLEKGLVQIYTGQGKGKTTAALGLSLRAAGHGNRVLIFQFLKPPCLDSGERNAIKASKLKINIEALNVEWNMGKALGRTKTAEVKKAIKAALKKIGEAAEKRKYDCIILDEIVFCLSKGLVKLDDVKKIIEKRDERVEIILTGRGASKELIKMADLVTEMKKIKHPFDKGIVARKGIEF
jgi:cob(I)alamin adenosyltransferase